ncbi:Response regulator receiver domain-containing protein [Lishizhenia tianjinensis]|uniref:Response regulator receiver domain-containing protein n=1 Tax=Lishizhenia tianjinensis TaxID=477690 RepID=A0A1I7AXY7_9FLAO|nr:response regulator [Lishizhenia tianjinensis]SFT79751.1 Response regulator receiver domain-containing protein [Lishizhenia tianjinensis]
MQKVILIDDDHITHFIFENLLSDEGIDFKAYDSAQSFLNENKSVEDCILLMDVNMPVISGYQLWSILNENYDLSSTSVTIFTSDIRVKNEFSSLNSNVHFIEKHEVNLDTIKALQHGDR